MICSSGKIQKKYFDFFSSIFKLFKILNLVFRRGFTDETLYFAKRPKKSRMKIFFAEKNEKIFRFHIFLYFSWRANYLKSYSSKLQINPSSLTIVIKSHKSNRGVLEFYCLFVGSQCKWTNNEGFWADFDQISWFFRFCYQL